MPTKSRTTVRLVLTSGCILLAPHALAGTVSPVQSDATTIYDLEAIAPVQLAGSDQAALDFFENDMPELLSIVDANLSERTAVQSVTDFALDPNPLYLSVPSDVRVYFLGEGAGYRNSSGFYTGESTGGVEGSTDAALIFPDASSTSAYSTKQVTEDHSISTPPAPGDFVDIGSFDADTEVFYKVDARYALDHALAIAWNDPELAIDWPVATADVILSEADARAMSFTDWCGRARRAA